MRVNLTNEEAAWLLDQLDSLSVEDAVAAALYYKLRAAKMSQVDDRTDFKVDDVRCVRMRGNEILADKRYEGQRFRGNSITRYGWLLTHEPTGKLEWLAPSNGEGVTRKYAKQRAPLFQEMCEMGLT